MFKITPLHLMQIFADRRTSGRPDVKKNCPSKKKFLLHIMDFCNLYHAIENYVNTYGRTDTDGRGCGDGVAAAARRGRRRQRGFGLPNPQSDPLRLCPFYPF